ncbi:MAG: T9SS type A sorting domain-containing protein [bacterium]|nr:T9SS type A sorting domain-containing protein [bacterium]
MFRKIIGVVILFLMGATVNAWQQDAITNIGQLDSGGTISALTTALNGKIYGSTESGNIFAYDSALGIQELGYVGMNVNAIITGKDSLIYGGGVRNDSPYIFVYNPNSSWTPGTNPLRIKVDSFVNVVQSLACGKDSLIYIGTGIPFEENARLYKYNPFTQAVSYICRPSADKHIISCLTATYNGKICGGLYGGSANAEDFFVYDPAGDSLIICVNIEYVQSGVRDMVTGLDGQVYGFTENYLLRYDPAGSWNPGYTPSNNPYEIEETFTYNSEKITTGNNGRLYISGSNNFYSYDPRLPFNYGTLDTNNPRNYGNILSGETNSRALTVGKNNLIYGGTGTNGYLYIFTPRPIFEAYFMTPEDSTPCLFDVKISDGEWIQKFDSVTYIYTEVPEAFTCAYNYVRDSYKHSDYVPFKISSGEKRCLNFYAIKVDTINVMPYIVIEEEDANCNINWTYDNLNYKLTWAIQAPWKNVDILISTPKIIRSKKGGKAGSGDFKIVPKDEKIPELPPEQIKGDFRTIMKNELDLETGETNLVEWTTLQSYCLDHDVWVSPSEKKTKVLPTTFDTFSVTFDTVPNNYSLVGVGNILYNYKILIGPKNISEKVLLKNSSEDLVPQRFLVPQYAVLEGNYFLEIQNLPSGYFIPKIPIKTREYVDNVLNVNAFKTLELKNWDFLIIASAMDLSKILDSDIVHTDSIISVAINIERYYPEWYGAFVLPDFFTVKTLTAYTDSDTISLQEKYDYTITHIDNYNVVTVRNEYTYKHLELVYKSAYEWEQNNVYTGSALSDYCRALAIGDGNNDGVNELYGAGGIDRVYQSKKTDGNWATTDLTGDIGDDMNGIAVGDVDTSFAGNEIYVGGDDARLQQIKWNGSSWSTTVVATLGDNIKQVSIGDGNNDGISEVYCASLNNHAYQLKKTGSTWTTTDLTDNCGDDMYAVAVGDADSTFTGNEVYAGTKDGTSTDGRLYEITYTNGTWTKTTIADLGSHINWISVGDGNNDEKGEVYVACEDVHIYQFRKTNGSWVKTDVGIGQTGTSANMYQVVVGDGNNDAENEVFGVSRAIGTNEVGYVFQFKWNGSSWDKVEVSSSTNRGYFSIALGNADPNFAGNEVYGACDWTASPELLPHIYEFTYSSLLSYSMGNKKTIGGNKEYIFEIKGKNPLTNQTVFKYSIPAESFVKLTLYEVSGRVAKRICNEKVKAGTYSVTLNAKGLKTGIYLVRFETEGFKATKKLILIH